MPADLGRRALFARHAVLGHLRPHELDRVLAFAVMRRYRAGEVIFQKGEPEHSMMSIIAGRVKISVSAPGGREAVLAVLGTGEILGEMALLDGKPRSVTATALEVSEVLVLHRRDFIPFLEQNPSIAIRLLSVLCERLRRTSALVEERIILSLPTRLAKTLLDLASADTRTVPVGARVELHMSQKTFASLLGTSRETLNKLLHAWRVAGLIRAGPGYAIIEQPEALARIADG